MTNKEFVEKIGPLASEDMKQTGVLASVTIAQAILESAFGSSELAAKANNLFGMKATLSGNNWSSDWDGRTYTKKTKEQNKNGEEYTVTAAFRKYSDYAASIKDHSDYLTGAKNGSVLRYAGLVGCKDYKTAITIIKNGGYATDVNYVAKICNIIRVWNLTKYDVKDTVNTGNAGNVENVGGNAMNVFVCVGHAKYPGGVISSADGTSYGGVNEYEYNKKLAPYVVKWLKAAGHKATLCIAPEGKLKSLNDEINYFIGLENKGDYDLAVQLHLNAYNGQAYGCEAYAYNDAGLKVAKAICEKLGTVWHNRGPQIKTGLYWTRKTKAKAVLIESFFCDSKSDYEKAKKLGFDAHGKLIAEGIIGKSISGSAGNSGSASGSSGTNSTVKYTVQIGAYSKKENADAMLKKIKAAGFDGFIKAC